MAAHTDNSVLIDAPLDLVWAMTNDVPRWPQLFSEYAEAEVVGEHDNVVRFRLRTHPDPQGRVWSWVSERELDRAALLVRARRIETGVFKYMNLVWEYLPEPGGIRLRWVQDFEMKAEAHTDDAGMADYLNRASQAQQQHIKQCVEAAVASAAVGVD